MSKINLNVATLRRNILLSNIPRSKAIRVNNKLKIKLMKSNKVFLSQKISDHAIFTHKRYFGSGKKNLYYRHLYDDKIEKLINDQINMEFVASYTYLGIANYYARSSVALPGLYGFFMKMYYEEQNHALGFIKYQHLRGGIVCLQPILPVDESEFPDILDVFNLSLTMEKNVKEKLIHMYNVASDVKDTDVQNMLDQYIAQQENSIYDMSRLYTRAAVLTCSEVGKYLFDRELHETHVKENPGKCTAEVGSKLYT